MARKAAEKKEKVKKPTLTEYNSGYQKRVVKVGQRVDFYRIPYKQKGLAYTGVIKKIIHEGALGCWVVHERIDTGKESIDYLYLGKIYNGWDKPFD